MALQKLRCSKLPLQSVFCILKRSRGSGSLTSGNQRKEDKGDEDWLPQKQKTRKLPFLLDVASQQDFNPNNNCVYNKEEKQTIKANSRKLHLFLKGVKRGRYQYLVDKNAALKLVKHLKNDLEDNDVIVEISPGLGVLTEVLLAFTDKPVYAYEPCNVLWSHLASTLLPQHSSLHLFSLDIQKFYSYYIIDKRVLECNYMHEMLSPLPLKDDQGVSPVKIVGVIYDLKFISRLTLSFTLQCCFFERIYPVFYLYLPYKSYCCLDRHHRHYRNKYLTGRHLFWHYFTMEKLDTAPRAGFYPSPALLDRGHPENEDLLLVKISHNPDIFNKVRLCTSNLSFSIFIFALRKVRT